MVFLRVANAVPVDKSPPPPLRVQKVEFVVSESRHLAQEMAVGVVFFGSKGGKREMDTWVINAFNLKSPMRLGDSELEVDEIFLANIINGLIVNLNPQR